jgi:hypothetical protein
MNRAILLIALLAATAWGQGRAVDPQRWGLATINPYGETFETDYVSPALHKWYQPRYLPESYMSPWYNPQTNYARDSYARYI